MADMDKTSFKIARAINFALVFACAAVVLGITVNLNSRLSSTGIHDFLIFSLVVSILTIIVCIILALRSQPRVEAGVVFVLGVLWLTMGAYSTDVVGQQSCYAQRGQTIPANSDTTYSAESYCRQMKTVQAFSWANFVFLAILFGLLVGVGMKLNDQDKHDVWKDAGRSRGSDPEMLEERHLTRPPPPIGYPAESPVSPVRRGGSGRSTSGRSTSGRSGRSGQRFVYPDAYGASPMPMPQVIQQQPGHSVIVRNGEVFQVPGSVTSI
ncbi:membrane-associating domain protein [Ceratobasidium sp. AG-Ba]|nr:membrane-associating domain protein [Ceratobasidium sp. AG-Ba]QRW02692.1 membrane-associating domain protein [Ceratobasidium sp. AG-Ba]